MGTQTMWQRLGNYEYEVAYDYDQHGYSGPGYYTGWCRYANGRQANGSWPAWNNKTGEHHNR